MTDPEEPAAEEPEFSQERVEEMRELNDRAPLLDEDGSAL